jgi:hypothetical protein
MAASRVPQITNEDNWDHTPKTLRNLRSPSCEQV